MFLFTQFIKTIFICLLCLLCSKNDNFEWMWQLKFTFLEIKKNLYNNIFSHFLSILHAHRAQKTKQKRMSVSYFLFHSYMYIHTYMICVLDAAGKSIERENIYNSARPLVPIVLNSWKLLPQNDALNIFLNAD